MAFDSNEYFSVDLDRYMAYPSSVDSEMQTGNATKGRDQARRSKVQSGNISIRLKTVVALVFYKIRSGISKLCTSLSIDRARKNLQCPTKCTHASGNNAAFRIMHHLV